MSLLKRSMEFQQQVQRTQLALQQAMLPPQATLAAQLQQMPPQPQTLSGVGTQLPPQAQAKAHLPAAFCNGLPATLRGPLRPGWMSNAPCAPAEVQRTCPPQEAVSTIADAIHVESSLSHRCGSATAHDPMWRAP